MLVYVSWFANKGNIKCVVKSLTQYCTDSLFVLMVASCSSVVHWAELGQVGNPQTSECEHFCAKGGRLPLSLLLL